LSRLLCPASTTNVAIAAFTFTPDPITIQVGDTVQWTNFDADPHTATSDQPGLFDTGTLNQGQSKTITFNTVGTYTYYCIFHPDMRGTIEVKPVPVQIVFFTYDPAEVTINVGNTVEWTQLDEIPHTVTSTPAGIFDSGVLSKGNTFSFTFTQAGTYSYYCDLHPAMVGTVTVLPNSPPAAPSNLKQKVDKKKKQVQLSWKDNASGGANEASFEIEQAPKPKKKSDKPKFKRVARVPADKTSFTHKVKKGTYLYRVRACNALGCSDYSTTVEAKVS